jgi:hypothetical protein
MTVIENAVEREAEAMMPFSLLSSHFFKKSQD